MTDFDPGKRLEIEEAQRLAGSCPMIFTWNGSEFEFITDVLGVAPLGASAGDGEYFPVDHDEAILIPAGSLVERDGALEIRVTEELREIAYLDQFRLLAVDRPADERIVTNDKFKGPPFPEFRLYRVADPRRPTAAWDHHDQDVRERLLALDETYPDRFSRDYAGLAELHHLTVEFGAEARGADLLVLAGWVDWADGSTFLGSDQAEGPGLVMPYLQVRDRDGRWQTVVEDLGVPAGKPKTIAVDLTGKWLSDRREVRIVTSACVYWDEILLTRVEDSPGVRHHTLPGPKASIAFRGFSRPVIHPERKQPERFVHADRRDTSMWNPTPGLYTRYGDVSELLAEVDDRLVVMGSGDEVRLLFDPSALPELPDGFERDYVLVVDGWAKDGDANTAYSQTVEPLPYHGMPQYPYAAPDAFPAGPEHRRWREETLTRPALRLIRPLVPASEPTRAPGKAPEALD